MSKDKHIKISELIPDDKNFNKGSQFGNSLIEKSFTKFGAGRSILLDKNNRIIAGNKSVENASAIGMEDVQIVESDGKRIIAVKRTDIDLDTPEGREMALADNASAKANIVFDAELVEAELGEAICTEWGIETSVKLEAEEDDFEAPEGGIETDIVLGDLFEIGQHRLLCGDSTDSDAVARLMDGQKADMVFTDPPYNVNYESDHSGKIKNDNMNEGDFEDFVRGVYSNLYLYSADNSAIYICHATMVLAFDTVLREFDWRISNKIVWVKDIPTYSMAQYKWQYEPIHFVVKGHPEFYGDKTQTNVWQVKSIQSAGSHDDAGNSWFKGGANGLTLHPTQKPIDLPAKAITNSSRDGGIVLDLFGGSGSTMVASEQLKRKCYSMELDTKFMQVIVDRMQKLDPAIEIKKNGQPYAKA